jgi:hypothetical protein
VDDAATDFVRLRPITALPADDDLASKLGVRPNTRPSDGFRLLCEPKAELLCLTGVGEGAGAARLSPSDGRAAFRGVSFADIGLELRTTGLKDEPGRTAARVVRVGMIPRAGAARRAGRLAECLGGDFAGEDNGSEVGSRANVSVIAAVEMSR